MLLVPRQQAARLLIRRGCIRRNPLGRVPYQDRALMFREIPVQQRELALLLRRQIYSCGSCVHSLPRANNLNWISTIGAPFDRSA